jgi:hypothetical protein
MGTDGSPGGGRSGEGLALPESDGQADGRGARAADGDGEALSGGEPPRGPGPAGLREQAPKTPVSGSRRVSETAPASFTAPATRSGRPFQRRSPLPRRPLARLQKVALAEAGTRSTTPAPGR